MDLRLLTTNKKVLNLVGIRLCFVSYKVIFEKLLLKFLCVCLLLEKLINEKYFLVKEKFSLIFRKIFS